MPILDFKEEKLRLLFGLKIRQFRQEKGISQAELSKRCGLSMSYLNEIEKGKKYPKANKIVDLAEALGKDYDHLVSLKITKEMGPIAELLNAPIFEELPLSTFGLELGKLTELIANAPVKVNAFIATLLEMIRRHDISREEFNLTAVRAYLEMNNNYFEELEAAAAQFSTANNLSALPIKASDLKALLEQKFAYSISYIDEENYPAFKNLRSIFLPSPQKKLLIKAGLEDAQEAFIYGREIGFNVMNYSKRPYTFTWVKVSSFEEMLNNALASYFSGALLVPKNAIIDDIKDFLNQTHWQSSLLIDKMLKYTSSAETFMHRLSNILPKYFGLESLFFLRFHKENKADIYRLGKEMHLGRLHNPHDTAADEHFCRRWISIGILNNLEQDSKKTLSAAAQVSIYPNGNKYFVFSIARNSEAENKALTSLSIGLAYDKNLAKKIAFSNDTTLPKKQVGESCESCPINDCELRKSPPIHLQKEEHRLAIENSLKKLSENI